MKLLALCIPNYNRFSEFSRLLSECISQIKESNLQDVVQICVSDDCSSEDPSGFIEHISESNSQIDIVYQRSSENMGMDYNFRESVLIADSEFCWLIGNDDELEKDALCRAVDLLKEYSDRVDFFVSPFEVIGEDGKKLDTMYPLKNVYEETFFDSRNEQQYNELIDLVRNDSGFFVFLSNLIFRREYWPRYKEKFENKLNTIFIQVYMHLQKMKEGAVYMFTPEILVINHLDDTTNITVKRRSQMAIGLNDVVDYFFEGERAEKLKRKLVDIYIYDLVWDVKDEDDFISRIKNINSPKNNYYKKYFVCERDISKVFENKKILLWGAGFFGERAMEKLKEYDESILVFDKSRAKEGTFMKNHRVHISNEISNYYDSDSIVVVANHGQLVEIVDELLNMSVCNIAIVT